MLLTITTTHHPATDLGYLLHKHPDRLHRFELSFGAAYVYYPEASDAVCTACLLLDVDPVGLVRGREGGGGLLEQYVNDRPYVASSLMSTAIAQTLGSALGGRSKERAELAAAPIPLQARIEALPARGDDDLPQRLFEPLGYTVRVTRHPLDAQFPEWGAGPYITLDLKQTLPLSQLLQHLYVLIPACDHRKHYFVGEDELKKLLDKGGAWLAAHPMREWIARRYLYRQPSLARQAVARLAEGDEAVEPDEAAAEPAEADPQATLHEQRLGAVLAALRASGAQRVLDLGCGEGKLLKALLADAQFTEIVGLDVSTRSLELAERRLRLDRLPERMRSRIRLLRGALTYRDSRLAGFDAAALVEVIEHLDPARIRALERVLFEHARPRTVVLTTPNRDYNATWESLSHGRLRHGDHRFEWTRAEFADWSDRVAARFGYSVRRLPVGPETLELGAPSQMAIFERAD